MKDVKKTYFDRIQEELEKITDTGKGKFQEDERFWYPQTDKAGNASVVIRFIPPKDEEELPWARVIRHKFQGPGGSYFSAMCPKTIGAACPVCELNSKLWKTNDEEKIAVARKQGKKIHFISNVLVIKDPQNPDNEGKVFLFRYGKKIFDKIVEAYKPTDETEDAVEVFDLFNGANFKMKICQVGGFRNYDKSIFDNPKAAVESKEEAKKILSQTHSLAEFVSAEKIKGYDELADRLEKVLTEDAEVTKSATEIKPKKAAKEEDVDEYVMGSVDLDEDDLELESLKDLVE